MSFSILSSYRKWIVSSLQKLLHRIASGLMKRAIALLLVSSSPRRAFYRFVRKCVLLAQKQAGQDALVQALIVLEDGDDDSAVIEYMDTGERTWDVHSAESALDAIVPDSYMVVDFLSAIMGLIELKLIDLSRVMRIILF